jgi:hypothetical protein
MSGATDGLGVTSKVGAAWWWAAGGCRRARSLVISICPEVRNRNQVYFEAKKAIIDEWMDVIVTIMIIIMNNNNNTIIILLSPSPYYPHQTKVNE